MVDGLEGIRVIQTATVLAGPMAARLLADWGAEVIRVERPVGGDMSRQLARAMVGGGPIPSNIDYVSENINRNKQSMTLDMAQERGQRVMHRLLSEADVLLCNFRPRELSKFQLTSEVLHQVNDQLIIANLSGYGPRGPDQNLPGYEGISFFSRAGIMHTLQVPGVAPPQYPIGMGDFSTGLALAYGIMLALFIRERTGSIIPNIAPANVFPTKDGKLHLISGNQDTVFHRLAAAMGRVDLAEEEKFSTHIARGHNQSELDEIIAAWSVTIDAADLQELLNEHAVPNGRMYRAPEMLEDDHFAAREAIRWIESPDFGQIPMQNVVPKLSETPGEIRWVGPTLGEHNDEVFGSILGMGADEVAELREQGVI